MCEDTDREYEDGTGVGGDGTNLHSKRRQVHSFWWKQYVQEIPRLDHMVSQYLTVSATSVSPERLFRSVGLVKSDLRDRILDTTLIDVMWVKQSP